MRRPLVLVLCLLLSALTTAPLQAQLAAEEGRLEWRKRQGKELDSLFAKLKASTSEARAEGLSAKIWGLWYQSGDGGVDIMMRQARHTFRLAQHQAAVELVDEVLKIAPKYPEAWNLRAMILFSMGRETEAVVDIKRTLALEPRHFGALTGLTHINMLARNWSGALKALRAALKLHPFLKNRRLLPQLEKLAKEKDL
ncbi:MAG: hypothetical protein ACR2OV_06745 [Hyphomicrobiaceae bacterium]